MQNRLTSLFDLDKHFSPVEKGSRTPLVSHPVSAPKRGQRKTAKRTPRPGGPQYPGPADAPRAQAFDQGGAIRCEHTQPQRQDAGLIQLPSTAADVQALGDTYIVEAFEDEEPAQEEEEPLNSATIERESRATLNDSTSSALSYPDVSPTPSRPDREMGLSSSFAAQMAAVENDLAELAQRSQTPAPEAPTPTGSGENDGEPTAPPLSSAKGHGVFDAMAQGMGYATEFRLPAVQLSQMFTALDRELDAEVAVKREEVASSPPSANTPMPASPDSGVLLRDLVALTPKSGAATPSVDRSAEVAPVAQYSAIDVRHTVELVPQQTGYSCWAAGAAMLVAWRDRVSVDPSQIARSIGYWAQYAAGLHAEDTTMFRAWRLTPLPPQSWSISAFADLVKRHGPLWVASAEPGPHIRVVTGVVGDGSPSGTLVHINDPWEQGMAVFRMPNAGARYTETYQQFVDKQETLARQESRLQGIYIAHA